MTPLTRGHRFHIKEGHLWAGRTCSTSIVIVWTGSTWSNGAYSSLAGVRQQPIYSYASIFLKCLMANAARTATLKWLKLISGLDGLFAHHKLSLTSFSSSRTFGSAASVKPNFTGTSKKVTRFSSAHSCSLDSSRSQFSSMQAPSSGPSYKVIHAWKGGTF